MAALAEFERDLLGERVRSGIAAACKRGVFWAGDLTSGLNRIPGGRSNFPHPWPG
jgi:DNA invertase Pin-like site-specific DNA recombinase